jgi:glycosyltransferase involved in cell wall biosynthesis
MRILHVTDRVPGAPAGRDTHLRLFAARSDAMGNVNRIVPGDDYLSGRISPFGESEKEPGPDVTLLHGRQAWAAAAAFANGGLTLAWAHDQSFVCPASISWFRNSRAACSLPLGPWCVWNGYVQHCNARNPIRNIQNVSAVRRARAGRAHLDGIIVASKYMKARLISGGVPSDLIHVLAYHVRVPETLPEGVPELPRRILYMGRLNEMKGVDVLIEALALLPSDCELYVAGEGATAAELREQAARLNLGPDRITFDGYLADQSRVAELFATAAVVAVPSLWPEPFGIVGLEALARGKPVVASNVGGIAEWLKDGHYGYLVPPNDPPALAAKLQALIEAADRRRAFGQHGREYVREQFSWERHWQGFEQIIAKLRPAT